MGAAVVEDVGPEGGAAAVPVAVPEGAMTPLDAGAVPLLTG